MATDIAEVVGAALGLNLLFGIPLFPAGVLAGAGAFAILGLQQMGFRRLEAGITALVGVVVAAFAVELFYAKPDGGEVARHLFVPGFAGTESILLATGIIGATVMPHVVYLHSALTQRRIVGRDDDEKKRILRFEKVDVVIAMSLAGVVNLSMMIDRGRALPRQRPGRRSTRSTAPTTASSRWSRATRRRSSASPCSPRASPPPRSGRWRGRS